MFSCENIFDSINQNPEPKISSQKPIMTSKSPDTFLLSFIFRECPKLKFSF
jgi:hypothetical protein